MCRDCTGTIRIHEGDKGLDDSLVRVQGDQFDKLLHVL